jgi:twitching motility protein PilT
MAVIDPLLEAALRNRVELVFLEPGRLPRFRRGTTEQDVTREPLDASRIESLLAEIAPGHRIPHPVAEPRWEFDYEVAGTVFHFACLAGPSGWTASASPKSAPTRAAAGQSAASATGDKGRRPLPPIENLLRSMVELSASDLHLAAWETPRLRIHGELATLETYESPTSARLKELLYEIAPERVRDEFERRASATFAHDLVDLARFRVTLVRDRQGVGAAIRHVAWTPPSAETLELPPAVRRLAELPRGLVLLGGPPSSGRSSTLAALLGLVAEHRAVHVLTVERPVEFLIPSGRALVRQREIPTHAATAREAVEASRALDADVLALADTAEPEALAAAIDRAAAGVLVFAVVDAATVREALERAAAAAGPQAGGRGAERLASTLAAGVCQKLLRRAAGGGQAAVWEVAPAAAPIVEAVAEGRFWQLPAAVAAAHAAGALAESESLGDLVAFRVVAPTEARRAATDLPALVARLRALDPSGALAAQLEAAG